jgi:hypothetical protein
MCRYLLTPHPSRDVFFLRTDGVGVDGGRAELGVAQPVNRHAKGGSPANSVLFELYFFLK